MKTKLLLLSLLLLSFTANAQTKNYENTIEFNGLFEMSSDPILGGVSSLGLNYVRGYNIKESFVIGVGAGLDYSTYQSYNSRSVITDTYSVLIPMFVRAKVYFSKANIAPFAMFDIGYNLMIGSTFDYSFDGIDNEITYKRSGLLFSPTFGVDFKVEEQKSIYVGLSYLVNTYSRNSEHSEPYNFGSLGFRVGYRF